MLIFIHWTPTIPLRRSSSQSLGWLLNLMVNNIERTMLHIPHHPRLDTPDIKASVEVLLTSANFQSISFSLSSCSHKLAKKNLFSDIHFTNITDMHLHVQTCIDMHFYSIDMRPQLERIMLGYHFNIPNTDILLFHYSRAYLYSQNVQEY